MCVSLFFFFQQEMLYFAIDKVNLKIDTPDRENPLHETVTVAFQNECNKKRNLTLLLCKTQKVNLGEVKIRFIKLVTVSRQTVRYKVYKLCFIVFNSSSLISVWRVLKSLSCATLVCTWAEHNYLLNEKTLVTVCTLPLITESPADWSNLSTALNVTKQILRLCN